MCVRFPVLSRVLLLGVALLLAPRLAWADGRTGEQIYRQQCASCHGANGEGTDDNYPHPLAGNRTVTQLSRLIARSMPKDAPKDKKCKGADAELVASYIFDTFYSPAAQARNRPPRIELARLTIGQYQNAVADLIGSFRGTGHWDAERGLRGEYYKVRWFNGKFLERRDPQVQFTFTDQGPAPEKVKTKEIAVRWSGAVLAPETGEYEFIVQSENSARLWINDNQQPLIDAWVRSGSDTEHRATITLLGGRVYPIRLEFSRTKDKTASVALAWKLPRQSAELIPTRNFSPGWFPELFVVQTPFPPDDRSMGYERGTSVSKAWDQATTEAAIEVAGYVATHLPELAGVKPEAKDRDAKLRDFCRRFAERAFRRPLTDEQKRFFVDRQFERSRDLEIAVKRVVLLVLQSPRFLYRELGGGHDDYDVASRLSFGLWDTLPDPELLRAASAHQLHTREQVVSQAERMVGDLRTHAKVRAFLLQWLKVDPAPDLSKAPERFPGFDKATATDLRTSLELFLDDVVWGSSSDYRQLFLADTLYLNGRLARFYGANLPAEAPFQKVALGPQGRAGVLSHPYLMATFAYTASTSPIHRGVFLARNILGVTLRPPPEAFAPLAEEMHPELTTRERVALQTKALACQSCHGIINPLGFTLEHFDAVGRYRTDEKGHPIDATGTYQTRSGALVKFRGVRDLAQFLATSEETQESFVAHLFHHCIKQPIRAFGSRTLPEMRQAFAGHDFSIRRLLVDIAATSALTPRDAKPTEAISLR
jgi:hypothetical protein